MARLQAQPASSRATATAATAATVGRLWRASRRVQRWCRRRVTVALEHGVDALLVRVEDDGPGLGGRPEGRGILGMRERAAAVGGSLTVTSDTAGVAVRALLPLSRGAR